MRCHDWLLLLALLLPLGAAEAAEKPFDLVPAKLLQPRGGLGNVFAKLDAGQPVSIAYFGGSITAAGGWRPKTFAWFKQTWPNAKLTEINAAIGGTGSDLGVYRFKHDVLDHHPDLIFVEFAVNDGGAAPENIWRSMEGIVRQTWQQDPAIDLCYVYTFVVGFAGDLGRGLCPRAASADEKLAEYYHIPAINVALRTVELQREGKLVYKTRERNSDPVPPATPGIIRFTDYDGVHPTDEGHNVYRDVIVKALEELRPGSKPGRHELTAPFVADNWVDAKMVPFQPAMFQGDWQQLPKDNQFVKSFGGRMYDLWQGSKPGSTITVKFKGTAIKFYDLLGPDAGQVLVTVDGQQRPRPVARFDSYCSYHRLATLVLAEGLPDGVHEVKIQIHPDQPDRTSVTKIEGPKPGFDPRKYDGTAIRVGAILLRGELLP